MLNGQIDYCRGRYVFGWAVPVRPNSHCTITVIDSSGETIAETIASAPREDLAGVGGGRCDFAFKVGVPFTDAPGPVRVFANATEMPGSPLFLEADIYDGEMSIVGGIVSGWVTNRHLGNVTRPVTLTDQDGRQVMTVQPSVDPSADDPLFRPARFSAPVPAGCFGRTELCLTARIGSAPFAMATGPARLEGYLDTVSRDFCAGWLFSPDSPGRRFELAVYRDGALAGGGSARLHRADVASRYPNAGICGFELNLKPGHNRTDGLAHISIRLAGSDRDLFGGPFLVGSHASAVQDAHDAMEATSGIDPGSAAAAILRDAFADWLRGLRSGGDVRIKARRLDPPPQPGRRLAIVIPVYADADATRTCLDSVMRHRRAGTDSVVIVNDNPGDPVIAELVDAQARHPDVIILRNARNEGFIAAANRGMDFVRAGDVLLLNADTELFPGAVDELYRVLHGSPGIGTVTALSNNATLFSYPHPTLTEDSLEDTSWADLAAVALRENGGLTADIPTAHGFCMLIRRDVIDEIGLFDPIFGRGYAEENDFSLRASDRGWRHVAAGGALVRHSEARSFGAEKAALVEANLNLLAQRFPEYGARIDAFIRTDPIRRLRWPLDLDRLRRFAQSGNRLRLVVANWLDGGTRHAASDIETVVRTPGVHALRLCSARDGNITLRLDGLRLLAVFAANEADALFGFLGSLELDRIVVHHLLGFTEDFVRRLDRFMAGRRSIFHVHDFYYACPRVTMIDASGTFCGGAAPDRCERCLALDGAHTAYRMDAVTPAGHRALFQELLGKATRVVAPSFDAAERLSALLPGINPVAVPHPQASVVFPIGVRRGTATDICLLGAVGPHKGSGALLALARYARLNHPEFRFHVIGYTNIDAELEDVGNVSITGEYDPADLPNLIDATGARVALFLHGWPETFSYTLTEAVSMGLIPVVPDIGAPAERVRQAGFGVVFPFPSDAAAIMPLLIGIGGGGLAYSRDGALPLGFDTGPAHDRMRAVYYGTDVTEAPAASKSRRRKAAIP